MAWGYLPSPSSVYQIRTSRTFLPIPRAAKPRALLEPDAAFTSKHTQENISGKWRWIVCVCLNVIIKKGWGGGMGWEWNINPCVALRVKNDPGTRRNGAGSTDMQETRIFSAFAMSDRLLLRVKTELRFQIPPSWLIWGVYWSGSFLILEDEGSPQYRAH